jgi:photosystem II stability/assembly factor-like uncharacterized protein
MRLFSALLLCLAARSATLPANLFDQLQWRLIGPFRGGRVAAVSGVSGDPTTFYFGAVGGGVWKTTNGGVTWKPIFDGQDISSIGAIAVAPSNPNVIYAGTGEADIRSQFGFGAGVYKSSDAGKTWHNVGLRDTRQIAAIRIDPRDPDLVYVAALGHVYGPHPDRGVYRSRDGGRNWQKVLDRGTETGAADLAMNPSDSRVLYATVWNARRSVWSQYAPLEGPGSGLWKSADGGDHWTQIAGHGLPSSQWGRSGVTVAAGGRRVFLLADAGQESGLYRSDDAGETWTRVSSDPRITARAWYFSGITVSPKDPDHVYVPNVALYHSMDGGKSFTPLKGAPGGDDYHILWIDSTEPRRMLLGSDQGTNVSVDQGQTWSTWYNQPTAQMYHVTTDNRFPYNVYGAQQDSGSAAVPSRSDHGTIDARDFFSVGGGESGYVAVDPKDANIVYLGDTLGTVTRMDRSTGQAQIVTPWPARNGGPFGSISIQKYRFPWTPPLLFSPIEPDTLYYGAQVLLKTTDGGLNWQEISGDLTGDTRKDKSTPPAVPVTTQNAREMGFGVIYAIGPSPLVKGMIWTGSDTGLIHLTRDGGKTWQNVTPPGVSAWSKITAIEASHFDPAEAWATVERHRLEDYRPYLYRTRDAGRTWTLAVEGLNGPAYLNSVKEDPRRKGLLYAGTELGVAVSFDDGDHWQPLQLNLPVVSVRDLTVHGDDLVIATFGRSFWVLDNVSALRQIDEKTSTRAVTLFRPADAIRVNPLPFTGTPVSLEEPQARNPPDGAAIDFYLQTAGEATLEIVDAKGDIVRQFSTQDAVPPPKPGAIAAAWLQPPPHLAGRAGINRMIWDLRYPPPAAPQSGEDDWNPDVAGPQVMPGTYTVRLMAGGRTVSQPLRVLLDPRSKAAPADVQRQFELSLAIWKDLGRVAEALKKRGADAALLAIQAKLKAALAVAGSADRVPPRPAYEIAREAKAELDKLQ